MTERTEMFYEAHAHAVLAERARARDLSLRHLDVVHRSEPKRVRPSVVHALFTRWFGERVPADERVDEHLGALVPVPVVVIDMGEGRRAAPSELRARRP
jgi:hypothetical protein